MLDRYINDCDRLNLQSGSTNQLAKYLLTTILSPFERRRAGHLVKMTDSPRLHLGCGDTYLSGWINVDVARPGRRLDLRWDLRRGLSFPDGTADAIFSEYLFEHIDLRGSLALMTECQRVLRTGGVFRIAVPDLERYILAYVGQDSIIRDVRPDRPTDSCAINEVFYLHGHRTIYNWPLMKAMLESAGFGRVSKSSFGNSVLEPPPDGSNRCAESLYVEAIK
ncbi:MAG: hypothetical protein QOJ59_1032 [Thermomicrobiales bacterium]|jgi:predicted SAM-dependent methyltransferase|nr:hypothetical protein [Thermomicrobiales bacterium]